MTETDRDAGTAPVTILARGLLPTLRPAMRRVAERVIDDPASAAAMTISELGEACGTSSATVLRFCRLLGLRGYPQLRLALAGEVGGGREAIEPAGDISEDDNLASVIAKVTYADARAVEDTAASLSVRALEAVVDAIVNARQIDIYGVGASGFVAADLHQKLHRIGLAVATWGDSHMALTSAALLRTGDVAVGISHTGSTIDTVDALALARGQGATTVAITNFPRSRIARVSDHVLTTAARETTFRSGATASRLAQLTVVDCVFVGVAQRTFASSQRALAVTLEAVESRRYPDRSG